MPAIRLRLDDWMLIALVVAIVVGFSQPLDWMAPQAAALPSVPMVVEVSGSLG
jgi:hypothetical protein